MPELAISTADLNLTINHEPRLRDLTIAEKLGFSDPHKIRTLIQRNRHELESYGAISATVAENADSLGRGRPGTEFYLNEGQSLLVCMFSRTDRAAEVRRALIDVFQAYRRGQLERPRQITVRQHTRRARRHLALPAPAPAPLTDEERFMVVPVDADAPAPYKVGDQVRVDMTQRHLPPGTIAAVVDPDRFGRVAIRRLEIDPLYLWQNPGGKGIVGAVERAPLWRSEHESRKLAHVIVMGKVVGTV